MAEGFFVVCVCLCVCGVTSETFATETKPDVRDVRCQMWGLRCEIQD